MSSAPDDPGTPGVLTIDLGAVAANYRLLASLVRPAECAAVLKADAYGLGADRIAPVLAAAGARLFFVAQVAEGVALRAVLPGAAIAVLNGLPPGGAATLRTHRLIPVLNSLGEIEDWAAAARAAGTRLPAMLHVDTGMNRLGLPAPELAILAEEPDRLAPLELRAILSHLACSDDAGHAMTGRQAGLFKAALAQLPAAPASLANSSGIFRGAALHLDLVRPGAALYGLNPTPERPNPMHPVVGLQARILQWRDVDRPMTVGYGAAHGFAGPGKIATIAMGYADGYQRALSGRGVLRVAGRPAPVLGRVSMDLLSVDVSAVPEQALRPGLMADVLWPGHDADALAAEAGTIGYEVLTSLGRRFARRYVEPAS